MMSKSYGVMFAVVVALCLVSFTTAFKYHAATTSGLADREPEFVAKYEISSHQCTAQVRADSQYRCKHAALPSALRVEVLDEGAPPRLFFETDLSSVNIYRMSGCAGAAVVIISMAC